MIDQLMKPKDSTLDLTKMPNDVGSIKTLADNKFAIAGADPLLKFGDRMGVLLSQNGRGILAQYILPS
jgi:hypothetical protein